MWIPPKIWQDGTVWIIGGGVSIRYQAGLSDNLAEHELIKGVNDYLMPRLQNCHVIGTNKALLLGEWIDIVYFGDARFVREDWYVKDLRKRKGMIITCAPIKDTEFPYIYCLARAGSKITDQKGKVGWFGNTGASAINLAYLLGAKKIVLIGYDGKPNKKWLDNNWHKGYPAGQPSNEKSSERIYRGFRRPFETIARFLNEKGIEVINVTPDTAITDFKIGDFEDELAR